MLLSRCSRWCFSTIWFAIRIATSAILVRSVTWWRWNRLALRRFSTAAPVFGLINTLPKSRHWLMPPPNRSLPHSRHSLPLQKMACKRWTFPHWMAAKTRFLQFLSRRISVSLTVPTSWQMPWRRAVNFCKKKCLFQNDNSLSLCFFEAQGKGCFCYDANMVCRIFSKAFL